MKKTLSIILAILMIVTTIPMAFATDTITLYLKNTAGWNSTINAFCWKDNSQERPLGNWPGTAMTAVEGEENLYTIDVPTDIYAVIFNDGSNQSRDLFLPTDGSNCYDNGSGVWSTVSFSSDECTEHDYTWSLNSYTDGTLGVCNVCSEKAVVINLSKWQNLYIDSQGYHFGNDKNVPFEGKYILSGSTTGKVIFSSGTYDVIFHELAVENGSWDKGLGLNSTTLNAVAYGVNKFVGYNHAGLSGGDSTLNLTVADNSSVYFNASLDSSNYKSVNPETTLNIVSGTPDADLTSDDWYYDSLTISNGTPASHEYNVEIDTENDSCKRSCCSYIFNLAHYGDATCSTKDKCLSCGTYFYDKTIHENWNQGVCDCGKVCEHNDTNCDGFCEICGLFIGIEIKVGDTVDVDTSKDSVYIKFVAPETAKYVLSTQGAGQRYVNILNEELTNGDSYETEDDFRFSADFIKDEVRYIQFYSSDSSDAFSFTLSEYCTEHSCTLQTCKGYKCDNCGDFFGEAGSCAGRTQTCKGYKCEGCGEWFGEKGDHILKGEQTCLGYSCLVCEGWFGEKGEHIPTGETACGRNYCSFCYRWYGEPTGEHIDENLDGMCDNCRYFIGEEIKVGDTVTPERDTYLKFVPTVSGRYILSSSGDEICDPYAELLNSNLYYLAHEDDNLGNLNFSLDYEYTAGEVYYFLLFSTNGSYENYIVTFECYEHQGGEADCTNKAKCAACGAEYGDLNEEKHIWSNKDGICAGCGEICSHEWKFGECTICGYECKHSFTQYTQIEAPTCTEAGTEASPCAYCDAVNARDIPALNHSYDDGVVTAPTCTDTGFTTYTCGNCGDSYVADETEALGHSYENGVCTLCGENDPSVPDEPTETECDHLCHKDGILGFLWKIVSFFYRLFNINQYCECGAAHYDAPIFG